MFIQRKRNDILCSCGYPVFKTELFLDYSWVFCYTCQKFLSCRDIQKKTLTAASNEIIRIFEKNISTPERYQALHQLAREGKIARTLLENGHFIVIPLNAEESQTSLNYTDHYSREESCSA